LRAAFDEAAQIARRHRGRRRDHQRKRSASETLKSLKVS
jgi:hypothetical protein